MYNHHLSVQGGSPVRTCHSLLQYLQNNYLLFMEYIFIGMIGKKEENKQSENVLSPFHGSTNPF